MSHSSFEFFFFGDSGWTMDEVDDPDTKPEGVLLAIVARNCQATDSAIRDPSPWIADRVWLGSHCT